MLQYRRGFPLYRFNGVKYTKTLERRVGQVFRQAVRAWLRTMITRVPVKTGHARGNLLKIGRDLGVAIPINPQDGWANKSYRGIPDSTYRLDDDRNHPGKMKFFFSWSTTTEHFIGHDQGTFPEPRNSQIKPWPWASTVYANDAAQNHLDLHLQGVVPDSVFKYITKKYR